jgi:hypothetical protein
MPKKKMADDFAMQADVVESLEQPNEAQATNLPLKK